MAATRKVLITGGTNGMGKGVALALAAYPEVELIVLGRSEERGRRTCAELSRVGSAERVSFVHCDLASLHEVRVALADIRQRHGHLDAMFVNAGVGYAPRRVETEDGMLEHFQVNYLSQFMLTLNLLELLEASAVGGRVVFNVTEFGELRWDDLQLRRRWSFEAGVGLGMVAKHMLYLRLNQLYAERGGTPVACFGFRIPKTVWSNQLNLIPPAMKATATVLRWCGRFISIEQCGAIMAPLFLEGRGEALAKSGRFITWKDGTFIDAEKKPASLAPADWERLWNVSLDLCGDDQTRRCAERLRTPIAQAIVERAARPDAPPAPAS